MSNNTVLDGRGLFLVNLFGGFILSGASYFFSTLSFTAGGNLGFGLAWMMAFPIFVPSAAFLLWLLHTIFIWAWRSQRDKRILVVAAFASFFVLLAPFIVNQQGLIWQGHWSFLLAGLLLLWSAVLAAMRIQLWEEQEMLERARREDSF
jgi:hypothetical protein